MEMFFWIFHFSSFLEKWEWMLNCVILSGNSIDVQSTLSHRIMGYPELQVGIHKNRVQLQVLHRAAPATPPCAWECCPSALSHSSHSFHSRLSPSSCSSSGHSLMAFYLSHMWFPKLHTGLEVRLQQSRAEQSPLVILPPSKMKQHCVFGESFAL